MRYINKKRIYRNVLKNVLLAAWAICISIGPASGVNAQNAVITEASWYSRGSCLREGTSGIMANGKELKDHEHTCASWDYPFGTRLILTSLDTQRRVVVVVTDRGPSRRLYNMGRKIDLSKGAFSRIADLKRGVIQVKVEVIK